MEGHQREIVTVFPPSVGISPDAVLCHYASSLHFPPLLPFIPWGVLLSHL